MHNCRKQPGKSLLNGNTETQTTGRNSPVGVSHLLSHTCKQAGLTVVGSLAQFTVLADSSPCQPTTLYTHNAAVPVLPRSSPFLMKDESSLLFKMKVLSPACYRQKHLLWQPPYTAIRQKRNLSEKDKRAQLPPVHSLPQGPSLLPHTTLPSGEESIPRETFTAIATSSVFLYPYAYSTLLSI